MIQIWLIKDCSLGKLRPLRALFFGGALAIWFAGCLGKPRQKRAGQEEVWCLDSKHAAICFKWLTASLPSFNLSHHDLIFLEATRLKTSTHWSGYCWSRPPWLARAWRRSLGYAAPTWWRTRRRRSIWSSAWHETCLNSELVPLIHYPHLIMISLCNNFY